MSWKSLVTGTALAVLGFGCVGCSGTSSDPVAAESGGRGAYTVAPEATASPEDADRAQAERERAQAAADAARGRRP